MFKKRVEFYNMQVPLVSYFVSDNPKPDNSQEQFVIEIRNEIHLKLSQFYYSLKVDIKA